MPSVPRKTYHEKCHQLYLSISQPPSLLLPSAKQACGAPLTQWAHFPVADARDHLPKPRFPALSSPAPATRLHTDTAANKLHPSHWYIRCAHMSLKLCTHTGADHHICGPKPRALVVLLPSVSAPCSSARTSLPSVSRGPEPLEEVPMPHHLRGQSSCGDRGVGEHASLRGQGSSWACVPLPAGCPAGGQTSQPPSSQMESGEPPPVFQSAKSFQEAHMLKGPPAPSPSYPSKKATAESGMIKGKWQSQGSGPCKSYSCWGCGS